MDSATAGGAMATRAALDRLDRLGRTRLAATPTPLVPAPRLAARLGIDAAVHVKADAWTGFGLGGNKVRKLEYELAPKRLEGATHLVTSGGPQSNHCRVAAAAAARLGLDCVLVVNGAPEHAGRGNAALHRLFGAKIATVERSSQREAAMEAEAERIAVAGGKALVVPLGASTPRGAFGYVRALAEMRDQLRGAPAWIFVSSSSGGTMAGLVLGSALLGWRPRLVAVSADDPAERIKAVATALAVDAAKLLCVGQGQGGDDGRKRARKLRETPTGGGPCAPDPCAGLPERTLEAASEIIATDAFVGPGYGRPTPAAEEAALLFARCAGFVLDPVYTAKAAAAMIEWAREGKLDGARHVVFLHTGGHPALFR